MNTERYGSSYVNRIQSNLTPTQVTSTTPHNLNASPQPLKNDWMSNDEYNNYEKMLEVQRQLQEAIAINTELYGAQSKEVQRLQEVYNRTFDPTGIQRFQEAVDGLSQALDILSSASSEIKDNPAIRVLAFSLQLLAAVKAISTATNWIEYIVATASVAAATISFVSSMKAQKFATGGIVQPAATGDQTNVRMNASEMILTTAQQMRLYNMISRGFNTPDSDNTSEVVFKIQGHQLVGVLNNYSKKYNN
jgi:hypothetical protein